MTKQDSASITDVNYNVQIVALLQGQIYASPVSFVNTSVT